MGTIVEGEADEVLAVMRDCLEAMSEHCERITCTAKLDYRRGASGRLKVSVATPVLASNAVFTRLSVIEKYPVTFAGLKA